jgi:choline transport protein
MKGLVIILGSSKALAFRGRISQVCTLAVFWSLTAWIATSAVILVTAPKTNTEFVFTQFTNETGWPDGVARMLGLLQSALSLIGYDAITHMTEEMPRPTKDAPIAVITCVAIGGVT